jgi:hypothetical protein
VILVYFAMGSPRFVLYNVVPESAPSSAKAGAAPVIAESAAAAALPAKILTARRRKVDVASALVNSSNLVEVIWGLLSERMDTIASTGREAHYQMHLTGFWGSWNSPLKYKKEVSSILSLDMRTLRGMQVSAHCKKTMEKHKLPSISTTSNALRRPPLRQKRLYRKIMKDMMKNNTSLCIVPLRK